MFHSVGRILRWAKGYRKRMILGFVCSFFATWCTAGPVMLAAWALGRMIGNAWGENGLPASLPWLCLGGIVVLILLRFFFTYWKNRLQESIGTERAAEQRMELGDVLKRVSLGYFAKNNLGDILAALTTELSTLELQSMKMVDAVVNGYIQVAVILLCVAIFCPPAALVALIGVLVSAFALRGIGRQSARTAPVGHRAQEALSGAAIEYIHGLPVVKSFGQDGVSVQRFRDACRDNKAIRIKNEFGFVPWNCLHLFALRAASVGLVLTAGQQALVGDLQLPYFLMIALFSFTIFGSVEAINDAAHILSVTDSVLDRLEELERTDFIDKDGQEIIPERFDVALSHVSFGYGKREVLHDVTFTAPQGPLPPSWDRPAPARAPSATWWPGSMMRTAVPYLSADMMCGSSPVRACCGTSPWFFRMCISSRTAWRTTSNSAAPRRPTNRWQPPPRPLAATTSSWPCRRDTIRSLVRVVPPYPAERSSVFPSPGPF